MGYMLSELIPYVMLAFAIGFIVGFYARAS